MEKLAALVRDRLETQCATQMSQLSDRSTLPPQLVSLQANCSLQEPDAGRNTALATLTNRTEPLLVGTATLELAPIPLHEQIQQFARQALSAGCNQLQLLPLFLLPGVHVREDIPQEVALAGASLDGAVALNLRSHLGSHPGLARMLAREFATVDADAKILVSHGTRRAGGNEPVQVVAEQLGAVAAYWSMPPTLEEQIKRLAADGCEQIAILPYFLFAGGITDAIARSVSTLQAQFPNQQLKLAEPIGASAELADLIVDLMGQ